MDVITRLQNPAAFDHPVKYFKVMETHISWVILTGSYAYKIKKPVNYDFLDYSTLAKRHHYCLEEIRLNRLLAPEIYLGVVAITLAGDQLTVNGKGTTVEYAVKMIEFAQTDIFPYLLMHTQNLMPDVFNQLATIIAAFHQQAAILQNENIGMSTPEQIHTPVLQNFEQIHSLLQDKQDQQLLQGLKDHSLNEIHRLQPYFIQRKQQGFIRACHGDLHLGNIILYQQRPLIFDCIEFNDNFRWIDTMADLAFLLMDLEDQKRFDLSHLLLNQYCAITGDYIGLTILNFYKTYRAIIRAKTTLLRANQTQATDKTFLIIQYRNYIKLAESYCQPQYTSALLIMHGIAGTGKSTLANHLVTALGAIQIRSDVERKRLLGLTADARTHSAVNQGIYTADLSEKTYQRLADLANDLLQAGQLVIVDASFLLQAQRECMRKIANDLQIPFYILSCQVSPETITQRIQARQAKQQDPSEAYLAVVQMQQQTQQALTLDEQKHCLVTQDYADLLQQLKTLLKKIT